jgi:two-component system chemotaxis response regulator CheY
MTRSILIVDDSRSMRELVKFALAPVGYEITEAADGAQALGLIATKTFDLVITDLNMGAINGLDLTKKIRAVPHHRTTPILVLTTETSADKKAQARAAGATGWLVKPFDRDKLVQTVSRVIP